MSASLTRCSMRQTPGACGWGVRAAAPGRVPPADLLDVRGHPLSSPDPVESGDASVEAAPIRIVIVPTAAARGRPDAAADAGRTAVAKRVSARGHREVDIEVARIVDRGSASDRELVARLLTADLIH